MNSMMKVGSVFVTFGGIMTFCTFVVDGGEKALIFNKIGGLKQKVYGEGLHFKIPFLQDPIHFDVRLTPNVLETKTPTKDLQNIEISVRILFKPNDQSLYYIYKDQGKNFSDRVIPSITHEIIKSVVARYNADQLLTQREKVSLEIKQGLINKANEFNLIFEDVAIIHIEFSREYREAIESKQVSQQMAERYINNYTTELNL
jgi:prohibitin 1